LNPRLKTSGCEKETAVGQDPRNEKDRSQGKEAKRVWAGNLVVNQNQPQTKEGVKQKKKIKEKKEGTDAKATNKGKNDG